MNKIYANLLGEWVEITNGTIHGRDATLYVKEELQDLFKYDYVNIGYDDKNYRIHPSMIQVVTE